ncbi:hydroxypyruvate isomerase family protein [Aquamicrobium segne]|uniref:Hydroxypyruvate isomerase family protein n=1 Tax=Aquamicrobium segne TaxID=469547 RepID=A0ABW0GUA8_9HYPH
MLRFSANLGFLWQELGLVERIEAAAAAGFGAVELHWPYEVPASEIRAACQQHDLVLLGLNTAVGNAERGEFGLGAVPGREEDFQATIDQSIAYCRDSGATSIHAMAGVVSADERNVARSTFLRNLEVASQKAAQHDLTLLLEPINPRDKPGYFYSHIGEAAQLIEELGVSNIKLMFDVYHVGVTEGDVLKRLERFMPLIGHIQIAAVPSRAEPDEGEIAYDRVLKAIDELGYAGWIGCEYKPRSETEAGLGWIEALGFKDCLSNSRPVSR